MLTEIPAAVYQRCRLESHWTKNNKLSAKITKILPLAFFAWMFRRFLEIFNKVRYPFRISWVDILYDVTFLRLYSNPAVYMGWKIHSLSSRQINHHPRYRQYQCLQYKVVHTLLKVNIALINCIMIVKIRSFDCFIYCRCQFGTIIVLDLD